VVAELPLVLRSTPQAARDLPEHRGGLRL